MRTSAGDVAAYWPEFAARPILAAWYQKLKTGAVGTVR